MIKVNKLSASKIKTLNGCSYMYYCNYILKLPRESGPGADAGSILHTVLESFLNPRHRKHFDAIQKNNDVSASPAVQRLITKWAKIYKLEDPERIDMIDKAIIRAVHLDFYCDGSNQLLAEEKFDFSTDEYSITGFIDKTAIYKDRIHIFDYKSTKKKFSNKELQENIQALIYALAIYKKYNIIPAITFMFLRFDEPLQTIDQIELDDILGIEEYLIYLTKYLEDFDSRKACVDMAAQTKDRRWMCGFGKTQDSLKKDGTPMWHCQYRYSFDYFVSLDKEGKIVDSQFDKKKLKKVKGNKIEQREYGGCPAFKNR